MEQVTNQYIEGKRRSYAQKVERRGFCQNKALKYTQEADDIGIELHREQQIIERLIELEQELRSARDEATKAKTLMALADVGEEFDNAMDNYVAVSAKIPEIEANIRVVYYGR